MMSLISSWLPYQYEKGLASYRQCGVVKVLTPPAISCSSVDYANLQCLL